MPRTPNDLLLRLSATDRNTPIRVTLSRLDNSATLGEGEAPPGSTKHAASLAQILNFFPEQTISEETLTRLGQALVQIALPGDVRNGLSAALSGSASAVEPVHLRLLLEGAAVEALPWEFTHLGTTDTHLSGFLGLHPRLRLTREPSGSEAPGTDTAPVEGTIRVLLAQADPRAPGYPALPHLEAETSAVRAALSAAECRRIEMRELEGVTPAALERTLREWQPHIFHFIGHGETRPSGGVLALQGEREGSAAFVYADELAHWLSGSSVRLAVLSACRAGSPVGSMAQPICAAGVPAVVAMQLPLRDASAGLWSRAFYAALLEPCPVEEAMAQARQAVRGAGLDWGVPILYLAASANPLFGPAKQNSLPRTNLPYRPSEAFVGRVGLMNEMHAVLCGKRSAALVGMGGLGKTQLAVEYAHAHRSAYPGGVFWVRGRSTEILIDDLAEIGRQFFGAPEALTPVEAAEAARDTLARSTQAALLVCDDLSADTDMRSLPPTGVCRLILTAREGCRMPPGFRTFIVPVLDAVSASALLGAERDSSDDEREAASAIAALLGSLPLAIALVAHHVARLNLTLAEYKTRLETSTFGTLQQARRRFVAATAHDGALYDTLMLSYHSLTPSAQGVLQAASMLGPTHISTDLLAEMCGSMTPGDFEEAVADLTDGALAAWGIGRKLSLHELVRIFVREQVDLPAQCALLEREAAILSQRLTAALETGKVAEARDSTIHAEACAVQCRARGLEAPLVSLLLPIGRMAFEAGRFVQARAHYDAGLAVLRSRGPDSLAAAPFLYQRAEVCFPLDDCANGLADARRALHLARQALGRDAPALGEYYTQVGLCLRYLERFRRARPFYNRALALAEAAFGRHHPQTALCLNNLGILAEYQDDLTAALECQVEALSITRECLGSNAPYVGVTLNNLGRLLSRLGRWEEALGHHTEALALYEAVFEHQHPGVATSLFYAAEAEVCLKRGADAEQHYREALSVFENVYGTTNYRCRLARERLAAR